jgi:phosphate transport system permease protein
MTQLEQERGATPRRAPLPRRRAVADRTFALVALFGGLTVLAVLGLIAITTTRQAVPAFRHEGLGFITSKTWTPADAISPHFGAGAFIYGTMVASLIALVLSVPVSIGISLFITEVAPRRLRRPATYVVDLLAAIPSVVYGLWGAIVLIPAASPLTHLYARLAAWFHGVPVVGRLFAGPVTGGATFMTAGIILAVMITPIITSVCREVFATVPAAQKEGALALGATRWEMIRGAVFPHSRGGIVAGVMIGLGRALGETIAVALVIGSSPQVTARLFSSGYTMAAVIANEFGEAGGTYRSALIGMGVVLFAITIIVSVTANGLVARWNRKVGGLA